MNNQMNTVNYNQWGSDPHTGPNRNSYTNPNPNPNYGQGNYGNQQMNYANNFRPQDKVDVNYTNMYTSPANNGGAYQQQPHLNTSIDGITVTRPVGVSTGGECCCTMI